jgi:hypothetical protein
MRALQAPEASPPQNTRITALPTLLFVTYIDYPQKGLSSDLFAVGLYKKLNKFLLNTLFIEREGVAKIRYTDWDFKLKRSLLCCKCVEQELTDVIIFISYH